MFRCKECGSEFDIKPDYCDCGNDTFKEIVEKVEPVVETKTVKEEKTVNFFETKKVEYDIPKSEKEPQKSEPAIKFEKPNIPQIKIEPISLTIFLICILLSVFVVFFVGNPKEDILNTEKTEIQQTINNNIPSIDKIWDNTLPVKKVEEVISEPVVNEPVIQEPIKTVQPVEAKKNENKAVQQKQQKPAINTQAQTKPATTKTTQSQVQPKQQPKPTTTTNTSYKNSVSKSSQSSAQVKNTQPQPAKTVNPQEMINYKIALRDKIASKIDVIGVGDGTCVVSFKVSPSGTLVNRSFLKQSDNEILNDMVYKAIMSTPNFNSPPSSYNNETLKFTVKVYGQEFEISLN